MNFLDLRPQPEIKVIEKVILKPRSLWMESLRILLVIAVVSIIGFAVSKADSIITKSHPVKNFSAMGTVSEVASTTVSIENAKGSDDKNRTTYIFDTSLVKKIETKDHISLALTDISVGDKIVVQGTDTDGDISIRRIISFSATSSKSIIATTTDETLIATTTATSTATTTDATSSATTTGTSSPSVIDTIKDVVNNVVDAIAGTSTGTSSTSTPEEVSGTTTPPDTKDQTPNVMDKVADKVGDVVNKVVDVITGEKPAEVVPQTPPVVDPAPPVPPAETPAN